MNHKFVRPGTALAIAFVALLFLGTRAQAQTTAPATAPVASTIALSAAERAGLVYLREEEKLARDVYLALYAKWGVPVFNNIANSEAQHMAALKTLLDRYGIPDPAAGKAPGQFTNPQLQALYTQLVAQGSTSLADALRVGVAIEQLDIQDLKTHLAETNQWDIQRVYNNLLKGSQNHLYAFQRQLS